MRWAVVLLSLAAVLSGCGAEEKAFGVRLSYPQPLSPPAPQPRDGFLRPKLSPELQRLTSSGSAGSIIAEARLRGGEMHSPGADNQCLELEASLWVPHANSVQIELREAQSPEVKGVMELIQGVEGLWQGAIKSSHHFPLSPELEYRIAIDSNYNNCYDQEGAVLYRRDPFARYADPRGFDDTWCTLTDRGANFKWTHKEAPVLLKDGLGAEGHSIYEMHIGTFTEEGTFLSAVSRLKAIKDMGFTAIELMPCTEFGGLWGYNPRNCFLVHSRYGTPDDLRCLIDTAHNLGLAVIHDIVLNHGSAKANVLWNWDGYGPDNNGGIYFDSEGGDTPWGRKFGVGRPEVQEYLLDSCRLWLGEEYRFDGLRFDSAHNIPVWFVQKLTYALRQEFPGRCLIGEVEPEHQGALDHWGFDAIWMHYPCHDVEDVHSGSRNDRGKVVEGIVLLKGFSNPSAQAVSAILGSHDQIGNRQNGGSGGGRDHRYFVDRVGGREDWFARSISKTWWCINALAARSVPMLFQGSEILQSEWWHIDKKVRWDFAVNKDDLPSTFMAHCVRDSNLLRQAVPDLRGNDCRMVHYDDHNRVYAVAKGSALVVMHTGSEQFDGDNLYGLSTGGEGGGSMSQVFNSQAEEYGGWAESWCGGSMEASQNLPVGPDAKIGITLPKWSVLVFLWD